ncbi:MAG: transposase [Kiritimatiellae bacterium]|nr:transposase [Kiritimatiellia bacterium]
MPNQRPKHPPRLERIFQSYDPPLYFVTVCTWNRQHMLAESDVLQALLAFGQRNQDRGVAIGRFVIMPDHMHLFMRVDGRANKLGTTVGMLKKSLSGVLKSRHVRPPHWQPGCFDHVLRHGESYSQKWDYVRDNPVRAGLVKNADDWPYQGEIVCIRY